MVIGINGYEAVVPRFGFDPKTGLPNRVGSSEFCYQLLSSLSRLDKKNNYFIYLPVNPASDMPKETDKWHYIVFTSKKLWTLIGLSRKLSKNENKLDVFFSPTHYLPVITNSKSVISIMDVSYLHFPKLFKKKDLYQLKFWGKYSIKKAKKIITISQSSKSDIIKSYDIPADKIAVVYPGIERVSSIQYSVLSMDELRNKFGIKNKYILFVGTLQPRKNLERLIEAFAKLKREDLDLVIVGKKGWMFEDILNAPKKFGVTDSVHFLHNVTDEDLPSFYRFAEIFVLPSLYEGFGLPVLEAMKYGCPVITSDISSLPEAGGDAALYVDPKDTDDIVLKMRKLLEDENLRKDLITKGTKQVEKFSWEKSASETLKVLEEVANA